MSKKKILSIVAAVMLVVGIVGTSWSLFYIAPSIMEFQQQRKRESNKEITLYEKESTPTKLVVNSYGTQVTVRHKDGGCVVVKGSNLRNRKYEFHEDGGVLTVTEIQNDSEFYNMDLDEIVEEIIDGNLGYITDSRLVIYVPERLDLQIDTVSTGIDIEEGVAGKNVELQTSSYVNIEKVIEEDNEMDKLSVRSESGDMNINAKDLLGIKNLTLDTDYLTIKSPQDEKLTDEEEKRLPETLNVSSIASHIKIESNFPVAKTINIDSPEAWLTLNLPIDKYKYKADINSSQRLDYNTEEEEEYVDPEDGKAMSINGLLNPKLENLENQYSITTNTHYFKSKNIK
ncbi:MAG: DUF4097 domain-containing protein [Clostridioides sp.]|jgi:hypothetical protein|nr:DUF4097 domain-containing protein [Clostridioides sp.]